MKSHRYRELIARAREAHISTDGRVIMALLAEACECWKEESVGKTTEEVQRLHGAIIEVRKLMAEIERNDFRADRPTGAYA